jgi:HSP20 family protein
MSAIHWNDPFRALLRLQEEVEQALFRPLGWELRAAGRGSHPPLNVFRDEQGLVVHVEVPGYKPADLGVEANGRMLVISGKRVEPEPAAGSFHRRERRGGEFKRTLELPRELDPSRAEATSRDGILTIRVPLREESRPRRIDVQAY